MLTVTRTIRRDPFREHAPSEVLPWTFETTLATLKPPGSWGYALHNGQRVEPAAFATTFPAPNDSVAFVAAPNGPAIFLPGMGAVAGMLQSLVTTAANAYLAQRDPAAYGMAAAGAALTAVGAGIVGVPLMSAAAGRYAQGAFDEVFRSKTRADLKLSPDDYSGSPTYALDGFYNSVTPGTPIPIIYGRTRVAGQILSAFYRVDNGGQSVLNVLVGLGHGPINSICGISSDTDDITGSSIPESLELNGTPADLYGDQLRLSVRLGGWNQDPIPGFNNITTSQSVGSTLTASSPVTATTTAPVSAFDVNLYHPSGVFKVGTQTGNILSHSVTFQVRWRESGASSWFGTETKTVTAAKQGPFSTAIHVDNPLGVQADGSPIERILEIEVTRTTSADSSSQVSTTQWNTLNEIQGGDLAYPGVALLGIQALATNQLAGSVPTITALVEGRKVWVWDGVSTTAPNFDAKYDDGKTTKEDVEEEADAWQAINPSAGTAERVGFRFTGDGRTLNAVVFKLRRGSATAAVSGNLTLKIETESAGIPSGVVTATSEARSVAKIGTAGEEVSFAFASPPTLTNGARYYAILEASYSASATANIQVANVDDLTNYDMWKYGVAWSQDPAYRVAASLIYKGRRPGENPAWWVLDLLINSQYGLGPWVALNDIDLSAFKTWADYCDECYESASTIKSLPGHRWAGGYVADVERSGWELALSLAKIGRATLLPTARIIRPIIDKATTYSQLITLGNVVEGSMVRGILGTKDRANRVEVQFANEEIGYNKDIAIRDEATVITSGESYRRQTENAFGLTAPWRAYRVAQYKLNVAKTIRHTLRFVAPLEAISVEPGDVIRVAHELRDNGALGGRVVASTSTTVDLDRTITNTTIPGNQIVVRTTSSGVEAIQIRDVDAVGSYTTATGQSRSRVTVSAAWDTNPSDMDPYAYLGSSANMYDYRVVALSLTEDFKVEIQAIQYDASVYNDDPGVIEEFTEELPRAGIVPDGVSDLTLTEVHSTTGDGGLCSRIRASFVKTREDVWADVFWRENGSTDWKYAGSTQGQYYELECPSAGVTYDVAVRTASSAQARQSLDRAAQASIIVQGPWGLPGNVTSFTATQVGDAYVLLRWADADAAPGLTTVSNGNMSGVGAVAGYEIRTGLYWAGGMVLTSQASGTSFVAPLPASGTSTYWIRAKTHAGMLSPTPTSATVSVALNYAETVVSRDEAALGWPGTKTDCSVFTVPATVTAPLHMDAADSTATYQFPRQTVTRRRYKVCYIIDGYPSDAQETVAEHEYTLDSDYAARRCVGGWIRDVEEHGPIAASGTAPNGYTVGSFWALHNQPGNGPVHVDRRGTVTLEKRTSTDGVSFSAWTTLVSGEEIDFSDIDVRVPMGGLVGSAGVSPSAQVGLSTVKLEARREYIVRPGQYTSSTGGDVAVTFAQSFPSQPVSLTTGQRDLVGGRILSQTTNGLATTGFNGSCYTSAGARVAVICYYCAFL